MSLTEAAKRDLFRIFNLSEESNEIFDESIVLKSYPKGTIIDKPHEFQTGLLYVIDGVIDVQTTYYSSKKSSAEIFETKSYSVFPGQLTSILGLITGEPSYLQLIAAKDTVCAVVPRDSFYRILRKSPNSLLPMYSLACEKMSSLLFQIYYSITWITVKAGKALFRSGDPSEEFYIVLHGRLRQISIDPVTQENILISELTKGHAAGLVEMMTNQKRKYTIMAIRDTECACLPKLLINWLRNKHQKVLERLLQIVFSNAFDHASFPMNNIPISRQQTYAHILDPSTLSFANIKPKDEDILLTGSNNQINTVGCSSFLPVFSKTLANLKTIAIIPATSNINGEAFALELQQALSAHSSAIRITSNILYERMGPSALDKSQNYRFLSWLSHIEESRDIVLLVGDPSKDSLWTQKCIEQCDTILVLHHAKEAEALMNNETAVENYLSQSYTKTTKILILMHHDDVIAPVIGQTVQWLRTRPWICQHYHIKCPRRVMNMRTSKELNEIYSQILQHEHPNPLNDMSRLARYLTGRAVGIVLGGGGARGCSHVGVVRAFQEAGIPIDMVGGTSIGAFMGALWAKENKIHKFAQAARDFSNNFGPLWKKITDLTYPAVSFFTGSNFNNDIYRAIGDVQIEDLWLPYFNVTTDITNCKMRVHTNGSLWRYVRSSMTLTGYLPPLCDPYDGAYLLDGGYMNNLAADVMASLGAKTIFAVDVGSSIDTNLTDYGDFISGWWYLWKTFFSSSFRVPNMIEIQSRLAYVSCVKHLEQVKESGICHYLRPPIEKYLTLQFNLFDEISEVGYKYGRSMIEKWSKDPEMIRELASISVDLSPLKSQKKTFYTKMKDLKKYAINIFDESEYPTIDLGDVLDEFELCSQSISNMLLNSGINGKIDRRRTSSFNIDYLSKKKVSSHEDDSLKSKLTVASKDEILVTLKEQNDNKVTFGLHSESDEEDSMYLTNSREEYELITNSDPENNLNSYQPLAKKINQKKRRLLRYRSEQRRFSSDEI